MLIAAMGGHEEGVALLVVQQEQRSAPQDDPQPSNQSTREKHLAVE
jgi:hypothetical protein